VGAEQRLRRRAPPRHRQREDRDLGAVQERAERRAAQHLRRHPDSQNNLFFTDFRLRHIGRIDAKTGELKLFAIPGADGVRAPRRGMMDAQDRLWFGQYRGDRIGMLDTRSGQFKEWQLATRWASPYDVTIDKNEEAWTGSMITDLVTRLDTKSGSFTEYLLPRTTNIRRVFVDNSTSPVTFWVGSNHGASIVKLEPLD